MDLELIAGVVSESLNRAAEGESKKEEERDSSVLTPVDDNPQPQISGATDSAILGSLSSRLAAAPTRMGRALKSVWMQTTQTGPAAQEKSQPVPARSPGGSHGTCLGGTQVSRTIDRTKGLTRLSQVEPASRRPRRPPGVLHHPLP